MNFLFAFFAFFLVVDCVPFDPDVIIVEKQANPRPFNPFFGGFDDDDDDGPFGSPFGDLDRPGSFPVNFGENSNTNPFWNRFSQMMKDFQEQMNSFFTGGDFIPANIPPNYQNSTYETKNVNGTLITVNETIKSHGDNNSQSVFHIKVVQYKPPTPKNETKIPEGVVPNVKPEAVPAVTSTPASQDKTPAEKVEDTSQPSVEMNEP